MLNAFTIYSARHACPHPLFWTSLVLRHETEEIDSHSLHPPFVAFATAILSDAYVANPIRGNLQSMGVEVVK
jgi:hypothetical protein